MSQFRNPSTKSTKQEGDDGSGDFNSSSSASKAGVSSSSPISHFPHNKSVSAASNHAAGKVGAERDNSGRSRKEEKDGAKGQSEHRSITDSRTTSASSSSSSSAHPHTSSKTAAVGASRGDGTGEKGREKGDAEGEMLKRERIRQSSKDAKGSSGGVSAHAASSNQFRAKM
jgi:hypothetical protein